MPRPQNTAERRAQIVRALQRVMASKGYEGATIADVAREAGLTAGLVHYHFDSKLAVLLALQDDLVARHGARIDAWVSRARTPAGRVAAFIDCHLARGAEEDPDALLCWLALTALAVQMPEVRSGHARGVASFVARLEGEIRTGASAGVFRVADARAAATALFAVIDGYYALHGAAPGIIPRGSAAGAVHRMAEGLLGTRRSSKRAPAKPARDGGNRASSGRRVRG